MKQAKSLFSKAAFNSIVTVVITQINQRQTFGDGGGWKLYSKLKHYKLLTSGHSLPLRNHSCPFSVYCLSVGTTYCDTEPWNFCPVIRNTVCEGLYSCTGTFWPLSALGEAAIHCGGWERKGFASPGFFSCSGSQVPGPGLVTKLTFTVLLLNWSKWERCTD